MKNRPTHKAIKNFVLHLHPLKIDARATAYNRTFGLGGIAALLTTILFVTGLFLKFEYIPSAGKAYDSILSLKHDIIFGSLLRNIHYWSAMLLVVVTFLHLMRVFYSQSIFYERRKNWLYGLLLMFLVVSANFTGYLLPWDQLSFWAVTIMTNLLEYIPLIGETLAKLIRDGDSVGEPTLLRFYHFHTGLLPLLMVFAVTIHFWLVRKAGGVTLPKIENPEKVSTHPHLTYREAYVALIVIAVILLFSIFVDAPLLDKAKPTVSPNPSRAPWYFMGFQELLMHVHPVFGSFVIPVAVTAFFIAIPFIKYPELNTGVWFHSLKGKMITIWSTVFSALFTFAFILSNDMIFKFGDRLASWPKIISTGFLPTLLYIIPVGAFLLYLKKKKTANRMELVLAITTIILSAYITMMLTGSFLRGEGMQLIFINS
jgi:quinol-cytochrome oxidoreductase complex cytochrome b subunit